MSLYRRELKQASSRHLGGTKSTLNERSIIDCSVYIQHWRTGNKKQIERPNFDLFHSFYPWLTLIVANFSRLRDNIAGSSKNIIHLRAVLRLTVLVIDDIRVGQT